MSELTRNKELSPVRCHVRVLQKCQNHSQAKCTKKSLFPSAAINIAPNSDHILMLLQLQLCLLQLLLRRLLLLLLLLMPLVCWFAALLL